MNVEVHRWELVNGRRIQRILRIWDPSREQYLGEPGYVDCFDSPESAALGIALKFEHQPADYIKQCSETLRGMHVSGSLYPDPIRDGPFRDRKAAILAAQECRWHSGKQRFAVEPDVLGKLSAMQQVASMQAQTEIAEFIERYMYKNKDGRIAVRQVRVITSRYLNSGKLSFYAASTRSAR